MAKIEILKFIIIIIIFKNKIRREQMKKSLTVHWGSAQADTCDIRAVSRSPSQMGQHLHMAAGQASSAPIA